MPPPISQRTRPGFGSPRRRRDWIVSIALTMRSSLISSSSSVAPSGMKVTAAPSLWTRRTAASDQWVRGFSFLSDRTSEALPNDTMTSRRWASADSFQSPMLSSRSYCSSAVIACMPLRQDLFRPFGATIHEPQPPCQRLREFQPDFRLRRRQRRSGCSIPFQWPPDRGAISARRNAPRGRLSGCHRFPRPSALR